jgi:hypothetical protein
LKEIVQGAANRFVVLARSPAVYREVYRGEVGQAEDHRESRRTALLPGVW